MVQHIYRLLLGPTEHGVKMAGKHYVLLALHDSKFEMETKQNQKKSKEEGNILLACIN